ncbi:MAG: XTP/dITP diphosphohydrolase [Clostridia bacterium]|nr:XTP/dITP diphosphohydrolase [Clostridia bacterium]
MSKLVIATRNKGKAKEFGALLAGLGLEIYSLLDFPELILPPETGRTFEENAILKASSVRDQTGLVALGDDSGLEVEVLNGAPGIFSSRFAGEPPDDERNNQKLLALLARVPEDKRKARFRCVLALAGDEGKMYTAEGRLEGYIALEPRGSYGFGYDPLFYLPEYGRTLAELGPEVKDKISHRARAVQNLLPALKEVFGID